MKFAGKFVLHRATFVVLSMLVQLFILIGVIWKFYDYFAFFYGVTLLLSAAAVIYIINSNFNPVYKISWIIPILVFPIFGGLFYFFFGGNKLSKREKHKMNSINKKVKEGLQQRDSVLAEIEALSEDAVNQSRYIRGFSAYPPYRNTFTEYLPTGEKKFKRLKEELKKAERFIFLEYYIIEEGRMWNSILDILKEKAEQGVEVRLIYDDVGCLLKLPKDYNHELEAMGIKCRIFNPLIPLLYPRLNNRDHRKIAIIDGHTAFTGGVNLADEYINEIQLHGHWKDSAIMVKGEAVWNFTVMFLSVWDYLDDMDEDLDRFKMSQPSEYKNFDDGYVQPFADSPIDQEPVGETVYLNLINKAKKYVFITTPYLILDHQILTALSSAAKGGVDVRIITPHIADKWFVHEVTKSYYAPLIYSGVKIYEYTPGFIHSKTFAVDDKYGVVGTINMDYRSLYLHFECAVWMYNSSTVMDIKKDFLDTLRVCQEITREEVENVKWYRAIAGSVLRIFAPLM
jgi:cardiolipin synthase